MKRYYTVTVQYAIDCETVDEGKSSVSKIMEMLGLQQFTINHIPKRRSYNQNSAAHLWFSLIARDAREKGLTMDDLVKNPVEFPITEHIIKDFFRLVGKIMFKKESTTKLDTNEFSQVVDVCEREFSKRLDCQIPFPSEQSMIDSYYNENENKS